MRRRIGRHAELSMSSVDHPNQFLSSVLPTHAMAVVLNPPAMPGRIKVAVIGGGPGGITTLKTLLEGPSNPLYAVPSSEVEVVLFEAESELGGTFRYRQYENGTLVSSSFLTCFSDFRHWRPHEPQAKSNPGEWERHSPDHMTMQEYVRYLEEYVDYFGLRERGEIRTHTRVVAVHKVQTSEGFVHRLTSRDTFTGHERTEDFTHLAICSGLHVTPSAPHIPGLPRPSGTEVKDPQPLLDQDGQELPHLRTWIDGDLTPAQKDIVTLHSSSYRDDKVLRGKKVMILGTGETGMDLAYAAVKAPAQEIVLCTRGGFLSFPAVLQDFRVLGVTFDGALPIDTLITALFEAVWVHRFVRASRLRWFVSDFVIKIVLWFLTGTQAGCNQWVGSLPPERLGRAYTFLNKSARAMPYINRGWKQRSKLLEMIATYLDPPSYGDSEPSVALSSFPARMNADGSVVWCDTGRDEAVYMRNHYGAFRPDVVVFATGYEHRFDFLSHEYAVPTDRMQSKGFVRDMFAASDPTVAFIGFVRPGVGAIPPLAELQAQLWTLIVRGQLPAEGWKRLQTVPAQYELIVPDAQARITHGVDHSAYSATLANDMGAVPSPWELVRRYGVYSAGVFCFAATFPTLYRLTGPYEWAGAAVVANTELAESIGRRGWVGNIVMGVVPMCFYALVNLLSLIAEVVLRAFGVSVGTVERRLAQWAGSWRAWDESGEKKPVSTARQETLRQGAFHAHGFASSDEYDQLFPPTKMFAE